MILLTIKVRRLRLAIGWDQEADKSICLPWNLASGEGTVRYVGSWPSFLHQSLHFLQYSGSEFSSTVGTLQELQVKYHSIQNSWTLHQGCVGLFQVEMVFLFTLAWNDMKSTGKGRVRIMFMAKLMWKGHNFYSGAFAFQILYTPLSYRTPNSTLC